MSKGARVIVLVRGDSLVLDTEQGRVSITVYDDGTVKLEAAHDTKALRDGYLR